MRCENCGSEVKKGERYCPSCGMELLVSDYKPQYKQNYKSNYKPLSKSDYKPDYKEDYSSNYKPKSKPDYKKDYKEDYSSNYKPKSKPDYKKDYNEDYSPNYKPKSKSSYKPLKDRYVKGDYPERGNYDDYEGVPDRFDNRGKRSKHRRYENRDYDGYEQDYEVQSKKKSGWTGPIILFLIMALLFGLLIGFIMFSSSMHSISGLNLTG